MLTDVNRSSDGIDEAVLRWRVESYCSSPSGCIMFGRSCALRHIIGSSGSELVTNADSGQKESPMTDDS